jgi:hypothetical protein
MECLKCQGLMVMETVSDFFSEVFVCRCLNCGLMIYPTIPPDACIHDLPNLIQRNCRLVSETRPV